MTLSPIIDDGYTLTATIPAEPNRWPEIKMQFRTATASETRAHLRSLETSPPNEQTELIAKFVASHIINWNVTNRRGAAVEPIVDNLMKVSSGLLAVLLGIVSGAAGNWKISEGAEPGN